MNVSAIFKIQTCWITTPYQDYQREESRHRPVSVVCQELFF